MTHRGDWTGDGLEDVVARFGTELRLYPNRGGGQVDTYQVLATGLESGAKVIGVGDTGGDGFPDVVVQNPVSDELFRYDGLPGSAPSVKAPVRVGHGGWSVMDLTAAGDADGDGFPDFLARNRSTGVLYLYRGGDGVKDANGTIPRPIGSFGARIPYGSGYTTASRPLIAGAHDANGDRVADMWTTAVDASGVHTLLFYAGEVDDTTGTPPDGPSTRVGAGDWSVYSALS
ncbi:FG-GAP repeat domain-containing protein [Streptomyces sp. NPDC012769]|uniref:FG-GAP repeat domain-containing protein n=1 Tax=Streptomyces sp. NPDC012769 TaxID=3364848 RepID=UPI0036B18069